MIRDPRESVHISKHALGRIHDVYGSNVGVPFTLRLLRNSDRISDGDMRAFTARQGSGIVRDDLYYLTPDRWGIFVLTPNTAKHGETILPGAMRFDFSCPTLLRVHDAVADIVRTALPPLDRLAWKP